MPVLEAWRGDQRVAVVQFNDQVTIGRRGPNLDLSLDDPSVATFHARIRTYRTGEIVLRVYPPATAIVAGQTVDHEYTLTDTVRRFAIGPFILELATDDLPWRQPAASYVPGDHTEAGLLASLRADPLDDQVRSVYADWLEEHGFELRAKLLRVETAAAETGDFAMRLDRFAVIGDHAWRAVTSRAPIQACGIEWMRSLDLGDEPANVRFECPKRWSNLTLTDDDRVRHCGRCDQPVYYCSSTNEVRYRRGLGVCIAVDAAIVREGLDPKED